MNEKEKEQPERRIHSGARRDEKNRQVCLMSFKGTRKLNISFAPLEKL